MMPVHASYDFGGALCVVTGAGRGLGRVTADLFTRSNARVAYLTRNEHPEVAAAVEEAGERAMLVSADIGSPEDIRRAFHDIESRAGPIWILVNNAGVALGGTVEEITVDAWDRVMDVNVRGAFLCTQSVLPTMKERGGGKIVNVSSIAGRSKSLHLGVAYTTSKAAMIGLTRHVAAEAAPSGVNVNCVCPSSFRSPLLEAVLDEASEAALERKIPLGYIANPEQIARVILFLASDDASYLSGAVVDVNGGLL